MNDSFRLQRFVDAQETVIDHVYEELRRGQKSSHWMWFIFPQWRGLGQSSTAKQYGIASREEAIAYLQHPELGPRLRECTRLVNAVSGRSIEQIFGYPDYLKFRSSMTLFANVAEDRAVFDEALEKYFQGKPDDATVQWLASS